MSNLLSNLFHLVLPTRATAPLPATPTHQDDDRELDRFHSLHETHHANPPQNQPHLRIRSLWSSNNHGDTALHTLLTTSPPLNLVRDVINLYPEVRILMRSLRYCFGDAVGSDLEPSFVNRRTLAGATALHVALRCAGVGTTEMVELLLREGESERRRYESSSSSAMDGDGPDDDDGDDGNGEEEQGGDSSLTSASSSLASIPLHGGTYPLHVVCRYRFLSSNRLGVIRTLVDADRSVVTKEVGSDTPLSLYWRPECEDEKMRELTDVLRRWDGVGGLKEVRKRLVVWFNSFHRNSYSRGEALVVSRMLIWEALRQERKRKVASRDRPADSPSPPSGGSDALDASDGDDREAKNLFPKLKVLAGVNRLPPYLLAFVFVRCDEEPWKGLNEIDDSSGRTALHCAADNSRPFCYPKRGGDDDDDDNDASSGSCHPSVAEILALLHPTSASKPDKSGQLPLHVAARAGLPFSLGTGGIVRANPMGLRVQDGQTRLFPFQLAAMSADPKTQPKGDVDKVCTTGSRDDSSNNEGDGEGSLRRVELSFELLRSCPDVFLLMDRRDNNNRRSGMTGTGCRGVSSAGKRVWDLMCNLASGDWLFHRTAHEEGQEDRPRKRRRFY